MSDVHTCYTMVRKMGADGIARNLRHEVAYSKEGEPLFSTSKVIDGDYIRSFSPIHFCPLCGKKLEILEKADKT